VHDINNLLMALEMYIDALEAEQRDSDACRVLQEGHPPL